MVNNVILVGRLTTDPEIVEIDTDKKVTTVILAVNRNFKNMDGVYETDFIRCILWNSIASTTTEYCHVGDVIGVKGRLQSSKYEDENKKIHYIVDVIAERVTFLSTNKKHEEVEENNKSSKKQKADE
jgi:single-strand DNA-binding protein